MSASAQVFQQANPHALASIIDASATRSIVASQDIYDDRGNKLWARDQSVSNSLQQRLLERRLKRPLESCLRVEDGITTSQLHAALTSFFERGHALARAIQPWAQILCEEVTRLALPASVQLLLTTLQATRPSAFDHAVRGMALAGALQASVRPERYDLRLAMLGGLLHDLGEMYVNPVHLCGSQRLDMAGYRHVVTHPRIGELLLAIMTDYPPALVRAIGEHHERFDGTGYPMRRSGNSISPLGRLLAVMETALATSEAPTAPLTRTSFALRMVTGEYDVQWLSLVSSAAWREQEDAEAVVCDKTGELIVHLALIDTELAMARDQALALVEKAGVSALVRDVAAKVASAMHRLRVGWNSTGSWGVLQPDGSPQSRVELTIARDEMRFRMRCIERDCLWPHAELSAEDAAHLSVLWDDRSSGELLSPVECLVA